MKASSRLTFAVSFLAVALQVGGARAQRPEPRGAIRLAALFWPPPPHTLIPSRPFLRCAKRIAKKGAALFEPPPVFQGRRVLSALHPLGTLSLAL